MADSLISRGQKTEDSGLARLYLRVSVFCLLSFVFCPLHAEDLPDPTRPPAMILSSGSGSGAQEQEASQRQWSSGLQTIIISKSRRAAIIDGKTVELWAKHGKAQLIEVNEDSVVLETGQNRRVLTLFPGVKMKRNVSSNEFQERQTSFEIKAQPGEDIDLPTADEESLLFGHSKEEK